MQSIKLGRTIIMAAALGLFPALALAADKPTADEAKKVIDYYYHGKGLSPVLLETRICHDIQHDGDDKNECAGDVTGQPIKKGDSDYIWMAFMAPNGSDVQPVIVQLELNGAARCAGSGTSRYRAGCAPVLGSSTPSTKPAPGS